MSKFSIGYYVIILLTLWAFFEASIWFIIPDFFIVILVLVNPKIYKKLFTIVFISSLVGIITYYLFVYFRPELAYKILIETPYVKIKMIETITNLYNTNGIISILGQSVSIIPSKVWTFTAVKNNIEFFVYIPLIAISRCTRMFLVSFISSKIAGKYKEFIMNNYCTIVLIFSLIFFIGLSKLS